MSDKIKSSIFEIAACKILIMRTMLSLYLVYFSRYEEMWLLKPPFKKWLILILEKVICNIFFEISTLKNLHFDTNVAVLTEAFVNVWAKFVLAVVSFIKWRIRRSTKVKYK